MIRTFVVSALVLSLGIVTACGPEKPSGTTPPGEAGGVDDGGKKKNKRGGGGDDGGGGEATAAEDPSQKVCDAEVSDAPGAFFEDTVLMRLPKGMTPDSLVEQQPGFARTMGPIESVGCVEGIDAGAMINFAVLTRFQDDGKKSLKELRDETVKAIGYPEGSTFSEENDTGTALESVLDVPADPKAGKDVAKAWFVIKRAYGLAYVVVYETHPNAWNALKKTFKASTDKLMPLNPEG